MLAILDGQLERIYYLQNHQHTNSFFKASRFSFVQGYILVRKLSSIWSSKLLDQGLAIWDFYITNGHNFLQLKVCQNHNQPGKSIAMKRLFEKYPYCP